MSTFKQVSGALIGAALLAAGPALAQSQGQANSPYSRLGLGDYQGNLGGVRQLGMGGTGLAAPNTGNVNELNPALLTYTARTTWEAAFNGEAKTNRTATASNRSGSGSLGYLALAVPLNRRWAGALGLKPFSSVSYDATTTGPVNGDPTAIAYSQYHGTGGLSEAYLASGIHVLRDLNLGGSASYLFGTIDQTVGTAISTTTLAARQLVVKDEQLRYSDFLFRAAAHYRHKVTKDLNLNLGAVYSFPTNLRATRTLTAAQHDANGATIGAVTQLSSDVGSTYVPAQTQAGLSVDNSRNWSVSVDGSYQQWSQFRPYSQLSTTALTNTWRGAAGGEFTPDPGSVDHYFQRVTYRLGLSVAQMPYAPQGENLYDRAVHWGFGFPLPTGTPLESTTISLGFALGQRGNTNYVVGNASGSNVRETYLRMQLAATLGNRWFIKRRLQ
ncbi:MAG: hypothetical protein ACRYFK_09560 [Janthinobacterium lividum]